MALYEERHTPDDLLEDLRFRMELRNRKNGSTLNRSGELLEEIRASMPKRVQDRLHDHMREIVGDSTHLYERPDSLVPTKILSVERYVRD